MQKGSSSRQASTEVSSAPQAPPKIDSLVRGLEFEYAGVIIGDDLRYEGGHLVADYKKRAKTDQSIKGLKKLEQEDPERARRLADEIIKNTYRTLMTRGMKGCYVYATDPALREYLSGRAGKAYRYRVVGL